MNICKGRWGGVLALLFVGIHQAWGGWSPKTELPDIFPPRSVILFQGDSITDGGRMPDMNHYLGHGYQAVIAYRYLAYRPDLALQFINRGKSADSTARLLKRWDRDMVNLRAPERGYSTVFPGINKSTPVKPDFMSLLVGANDRRDATPESYERNLNLLLDRSLAAYPKLKIILGEPFFCPQPPSPLLARFQAACAKIALKRGLPLIPYQRLINETCMKIIPRPSYWSWDGIHPTYQAHVKMADLWIDTVSDFYAHPQTNTALIPQGELEPNSSYRWYDRHARILKEQRKINPEIVLIGDSITHFWAGGESIGLPSESTPHFNRVFSKYRVLNLGYGWDRTQNVLWRLNHGELDGVKPRLVVILVGTNNIGSTRNARANTPAEIAEGILEICRRVNGKVPSAKIVLMGILPRGEGKKHAWRAPVKAVNAILAREAVKCPQVDYLDIGERFVGKDGRISRDILHDFCHPTPKGYEIWAEALKPYMER